MHFVHKLSQAVAASEDLRCPSVYTLCLMRPCRPPSMHMGSMWSKNNLLLANLMPCQLLNALAGNVFFCRVFPSLHLQTWSVMTATCRRHVGQGVETTQHLKTVTTCLQMSAITWLLFEPKHSKVLVCLGWLGLVGCYWYELGCRGLFFHVLCRCNMPFLEKLANITVSGRHVGNIPS